MKAFAKFTEKKKTRRSYTGSFEEVLIYLYDEVELAPANRFSKPKRLGNYNLPRLSKSAMNFSKIKCFKVAAVL